VTVPVEERKNRYNPWMDEKLWIPSFPGQAAYITPALANYTDGPTGFKYATEGSLNDKYAGAFFIVEFPKATIRAFRVKPKGASFTMYGDEIVSRGTQCTGLTLAPDGALYACEWGKSAFKLGNVGSVIKLDDPFAAKTPLREETHKLLSESASQRPMKDLVHLLGHEDMRVRLDAQFELVHRNAIGAFKLVAFTPTEPQMARIHALWGLGELVSAKTLELPTVQVLEASLLKACSDADPEIRAQSVKLLGDIAAKYGRFDGGPMIDMLADASPRVRYFAAITLGKLKEKKAVAPLLKLAAENHPIDAFLRHAIVMGLTGIGDIDALSATTKNQSPDARIAAVVALRRLRSPAVMAFLNDRNALVVIEAARAIHDDESIPEALPALAAAAGRTDITEPAFVRRALNANLRVGGVEQIKRLVRYATLETNPSAMRVEALDILSNWETPAVNDRVEGWYRTWPQRSGFAVKTALETEVAGLLASDDHNVSLAATRLIDRLGMKTDDKIFVGWVSDNARPSASRVTALRLLATRKYPELSKSIDIALASTDPLLKIEAVQILSEQEPARALQLISEILESGPVLEKQAAYRLLGEMKNKDANAQLATQMDELLAGKLPADVQLDLLEAASGTRNKDLRKKVKAWEEKLPANDPLAMYSPTLYGGDAERGKNVFMSHPDAACIRCHTTSADGTGSSVGPNLSGIGSKPDKTRHYLLESLIEPNAYIVPGFGMGSFKLKDGTEIASQVKSETAHTLHLIDLDGNATTVKKADVVSSTPPVSMMPAMGAILTRDEIRDVIEYLESLK
jgi:putative heme-binding domain-containing protein